MFRYQMVNLVKTTFQRKVIVIKVNTAIKKASLMNNSNLPNLTSSYVGFIDILSVRLLEYKKPLDFSQVPGVSADCQRDFTQFLAALKKFEFWALRSK